MRRSVTDQETPGEEDLPAVMDEKRAGIALSKAEHSVTVHHSPFANVKR